MRIGIVGGGIGGLTAAMALRRIGAHVVVFEQAHSQRRTGAGISLWANALTCLQTLNLETQIMACGSPLVAATFRTSEGGVLVDVPLQRRYSVPAVVVHRDELQSMLLDILPAGTVQFNAECVGFVQQPQGLILRLLDGRELSFDLLVGADGIRSTIRRLLLGAGRIHYSGFTAWRGVAFFPHQELPSAGGNEWWGAGSIFGAAPMSRGRVYWYGEARRPEGEAAEVNHRVDSLKHFAAGWQSTIQAIVSSTESNAVMRHDGYDVEPPGRWSSGYVTLLGDAAHPMRANLGQGGCQAIEDAVFLAACVARTDDPAEALRRYAAGRRARAQYVARLSWLMSLVEHTQHRSLRTLRDSLVRALPTSLMLRSMDGLLRPSRPRGAS
jgi:2-polyprenyl-6-methoxyphenol hydroxylase-like FAD-dependent oxidoreductase